MKDSVKKLLITVGVIAAIVVVFVLTLVDSVCFEQPTKINDNASSKTI